MKNITQLILLISILISGLTKRAFSQSTDSKSSATGNKLKIEEWKDARFGMFIHWRPVALKDTEIGWSGSAEIPVEVYDDLNKQSNSFSFNLKNNGIDYKLVPFYQITKTSYGVYATIRIEY